VTLTERLKKELIPYLQDGYGYGDDYDHGRQALAEYILDIIEMYEERKSNGKSEPCD
jgi:hypothetical protein